MSSIGNYHSVFTFSIKGFKALWKLFKEHDTMKNHLDKKTIDKFNKIKEETDDLKLKESIRKKIECLTGSKIVLK